MAEMTLEQKKALALAAARARVAQAQDASQGGGSAPTLTPPAATQPAPSQGPSTAPAAAPFTRAGDYGSGSAGINDFVIKSALGIKQFFGGLSEQDKAVLREMEDEQRRDPERLFRKGSEIGAGILATAAPGGAAYRGVQGLVGAGKLGAAAAGAVSGGALEGLTAVGKGDTYGEQMADKAKQAGLAAAAGGLLSGGLQALARPFTPKPEAELLFQQGVNPTLQQGADSVMGRFIGGLTSGATNVRGRQEKEILRALGKRVSEGNVDVSDDIASSFARHMQDYVKGEGNKLMAGKRFHMNPTELGNTVAVAGKTNLPGQMQNEATRAAAIVGNIIGPNNPKSRTLGSAALGRDYLDRLDRAIRNEKNPEVAQRIIDARDYLLKTIRDPKLTNLEQIRADKLASLQYDANRISEAAVGTPGQQEGMTLSKLVDAYSAHPPTMPNTTMDDLLGPAVRLMGRTPTQDQARTAMFQLGGKIGGGLLAGSTSLAAAVPGGAQTLAIPYALSALGQTAPGAKALFGQYDLQKLLAEALRSGYQSGIAPSISGD